MSTVRRNVNPATVVKPFGNSKLDMELRAARGEGCLLVGGVADLLLSNVNYQLPNVNCQLPAVLET